MSHNKSVKKSNSKTIKKSSNSKTVKKPANSKVNNKVYNKGNKDIRNVIFKKINDDYSWGKYGDIMVIMMNENGYMNVTCLCNLVKNKNGKTKEFRK